MSTNNKMLDFQRKTGIVKFHKFYKLKIQYKYLIIIFLGMIFGLAIAMLQKNTGIYSVGAAGLTQGFARLASSVMSLNNAPIESIDLVFNLIFWGLYLLLNIPLLTFAYIKIGKHFALLSITYLASVNIFGFALGLIPGINDVFVFGDTNPENQALLEHNVIVLDWFSQKDLIKSISLLFYIIVYMPVTGLVLSLLYILGGSAGGADPISIFYSVTRQKSLGNIIIIVNISGLFFANFVGSYIPGILVDDNSSFQRFFSPNMILSIIYVLGSGFFINHWFPKNKPINVSIYTKNNKLITTEIERLQYRFSTFDLNQRNNVKKIEVICTYGQFLNVYESARRVDKKALIFTDIIKDLDGRIKIENYTKLKVKMTKEGIK